MTEVKHTPTPWGFIKAKPHENTIIVGKTGKSTCIVADPENAAFIVRACNSHYELVRELEYLLNWFEKTKLKDTGDLNEIRVSFPSAHATLIKAKGTT